jgi:hypothetical protein
LASERSIAGYRNIYARLLRLYPKPFRERFGEGMEQTFNDLCRERTETEGRWFGFMLWIYVEAIAGIFRENITTMSQGNKRILRIFIGTLCILIIPVFGNMYVDGWNWSIADFFVMGGLIFGTGLFYELVSRRGNTTSFRVAVGIGAAAGFFLFWMNAAAGIIGSEDEFPSSLYPLVPAIGFIGAFIARFKPQGLARAMFATALTQVLIVVVALIFWRSAFDEPPGIVGVLMLNAIFMMLWVGSGLLFRHASALGTKQG